MLFSLCLLWGNRKNEKRETKRYTLGNPNRDKGYRKKRRAWHE